MPTRVKATYGADYTEILFRRMIFRASNGREEDVKQMLVPIVRQLQVVLDRTTSYHRQRR
jgi:hypothetical protein